MFKSIVVAVFLAFLLSACSSSSSDPALEQAQQEEAGLGERCKKLQQDIEDLKGRPVRRGAAREYYQNECVLR